MESRDMKMFYIEYKETSMAYFGIEAETEEEALERFDKWRICSDAVYDVIDNSDYFDSDTRIVERAEVYDDEILTDEMYHQL